MERPENVDFVLKDIKSNILDSYVNSLENRINKAIEYIEYMTKQFESFEDKELITNRAVDISILEKILDILKGSDKE